MESEHANSSLIIKIRIFNNYLNLSRVFFKAV